MDNDEDCDGLPWFAPGDGKVVFWVMATVIFVVLLPYIILAIRGVFGG